MQTLLLVPIETKVRELDAKLLFSLTAVERGYEVILGSQEVLRERLYRFRPGIYIDKSISVSKEAWFREVHALRHRVAAWDEEGLVYFDAQMLKAMRLGPGALRLVDRFFAWGQEQKDAIRSVLPEVEFPMEVTGNPRMDILRPEFRSFHSRTVDALRQRYGRMLLINTSFPFANHYIDAEHLAKSLGKYPVPAGFFEGWAKVHAEAMASFEHLIPRLHDAFPEHTIIVRPHPSENHAAWQAKLEGLPRAIVSGEDAAFLWICAADVLVHFDCTTGIEAFLLGVPSIAYRNVTTPGYRQNLPNDLSYELADEDAVLDLVRRIVSGEEPRDTLRKDSTRCAVAARHLESIEGPLASERILDALAGLEPCPGAWRASRLRPAVNHAAGGIHRWLHARLDRSGGGYVRQKFPGLELEEITTRIERLQAASGRFGAIRATPVAPSCFRIHTAKAKGREKEST